MFAVITKVSGGNDMIVIMRAVIFKNQFLKPKSSQCCTRNFPLMENQYIAYVFSLINQSRYFSKPAKHAAMTLISVT